MAASNSSAGTKMRKRCLLIMVVSLIAVFLFLHANAYGFPAIGIARRFQTIDKGTVCGLITATYCVIQNDSDWVQIWAEYNTRLQYHPDALPRVNFSEMTVVAVFMGGRGTDGYAIEIKGIIDTGLSIVVKVEMSFRGQVVANEHTSPFHVVQVGKIDKWVVFRLYWR